MEIVTKKWYLSKTLWGSVVTIIASVAGFFGVMLTPDVQNEVTMLAVTLVTAIAGFISLVGRVVADTELTK